MRRVLEQDAYLLFCTTGSTKEDPPDMTEMLLTVWDVKNQIKQTNHGTRLDSESFNDCICRALSSKKQLRVS